MRTDINHRHVISLHRPDPCPGVAAISHHRPHAKGVHQRRQQQPYEPPHTAPAPALALTSLSLDFLHLFQSVHLFYSRFSIRYSEARSRNPRRVSPPQIINIPPEKMIESAELVTNKGNRRIQELYGLIRNNARSRQLLCRPNTQHINHHPDRHPRQPPKNSPAASLALTSFRLNFLHLFHTAILQRPHDSVLPSFCRTPISVN